MVGLGFEDSMQRALLQGPSLYFCVLVYEFECNVAVFMISDDRHVTDSSDRQTAIGGHDIVVIEKAHGLHCCFHPSQGRHQLFQTDRRLGKASERKETVAHYQRVALMCTDAGNDAQDGHKPHVREVRVLSMEHVLDESCDAFFLREHQLPQADRVYRLAGVERHKLDGVNVDPCGPVHTVLSLLAT